MAEKNFFDLFQHSLTVIWTPKHKPGQWSHVSRINSDNFSDNHVHNIWYYVKNYEIIPPPPIYNAGDDDWASRDFFYHNPALYMGGGGFFLKSRIVPLYFAHDCLKNWNFDKERFTLWKWSWTIPSLPMVCHHHCLGQRGNLYCLGQQGHLYQNK